MNRDLALAAVVLLTGLGAMAMALQGSARASDAPVAAPAGEKTALIPASRVLAPVVPRRTWASDPFTMARLGDRVGANVPFPPPPPVDRPPLPTMPFALQGAP